MTRLFFEIANYKFLIIAVTYLFFPIISPSSAAVQVTEDIRVISSDRNSIVIEYTPVYLDTSKQSINKEDYLRVEILSGSVPDLYKYGLPAIPQRVINIGVPSEFGNTIQILNTTHQEVNTKILPIPRYIEEKGSIKLEYKPGNDYSNYNLAEELVTFGEYGLVRDLPVQSIIINPIQFDATSKKVKLYSKILFRINYSSSGGQEASQGYNDELSTHIVLNYQIAKYWAKAAKNKLNKVNFFNSVLSSGRWFRFTASKEGIYRITRSMLASYGIDANTVDPRTIKIYNNGGKMLPENINASRPSDIIELAIKVIGEEDGKFDESDYIMFYGRGINFWDIDTSNNEIKRFFNFYSKENYYWITSGGTLGKRIKEQASSELSPQILQVSTQAFADWEEDIINLPQSGRVFLGDDFSSTVRSRTYTNMLRGRLGNYPLKYKVRFINASLENFGIALYENNTRLDSVNLLGYGNLSFSEHRYGREFTFNNEYNGVLPENKSLLTINLIPTLASSKGYLDFFEITYEKELTAFDGYLVFFSKRNTGVVEYQLKGFSYSNVKVFDVTENSDIKLITTSILNGELKFRKSEFENSISKYIAIGGDNFLSPSNPVEVSNSNLHGMSQGANYIIISHKNFNAAAQRLKNYRENEAKVKYSSVVIDIDEIFNEFGGGLRDPIAIRDFLKYAYETWEIKPEYVLFFGNGTYDFKDIEKAGTNFIPTWQSSDYLYHLDSYPSDDFFAKIVGTDNKIDLAIGRITNRTSKDADIIVQKIIFYETNSPTGLWRNLVTLVSDDGVTTETSSEGAEHTRPNENLANGIIPESIDINKIYLAEYPFLTTSSGLRKPEATEALIKSMNEGTTVINWIGHGNPDVWAHERVFDRQVTIPRLKNDKYFFITAATCDFGNFDKPSARSGAEDLLFLPNAGSIGLFTATRPVFSGLNQQLMYEFYRKLFSGKDTLNLSYPIGLVNFLTKQNFTGVNDQKYFIFGDPALRLNFPQYSATIDSVNGQKLSISSKIQIKALSNSSIHGHILTHDGKVWDNFNGEAIVTVFDSERNVYLEQINFSMKKQGAIVFRGRVSIRDGYFSTRFAVPKDISYDDNAGKIVVYLFGNEGDGIGYNSSITIGGTDTNAVNDGNGPEIEIYFDDTNYTDFYLVTPNSTLIAKLNDETGLNISGTGVGHRLEGMLNDKESDLIDLTKYFVGELDSEGKSGRINYTFNNLEMGEYKLQLKAWDVFNNYTVETAYFSVVNGDELVIRDIYNYPNPFKSNTTFTFQQNLNKIIDVKIKVYTIAGRLIKEIDSYNLNEKFVKIDWDGRDQDGDQIANGTYLYKLIVKTADGQYNNSVLGKLAVIR